MYGDIVSMKKVTILISWAAISLLIVAWYIEFKNNSVFSNVYLKEKDMNDSDYTSEASMLRSPNETSNKETLPIETGQNIGDQNSKEGIPMDFNNKEISPLNNSFKEDLDTNSDNMEVDSTPNTCNQLVYTRVLKCGSSTLNALITEFSKRNIYNIQYEMTWTPVWNMSESWLQQLTSKAVGWQKPWIYVRHVHFIDFMRYGNWNKMPGYFGHIRDPVDRIISWYYYRLKQYNPNVISLDECVRNKFPQECVHVHSKIHNNFAIIPFFCGHDKMCLYPNSQSLQIAKANVEKHYSVVGFSEDFESYLYTLEYMFPKYFTGLMEYYNTTRVTNMKVNGRRKEVLEETREKIRASLGFEYDFYNFIKKRFYILYSKIMKERQRK